MNHFYAVQQQMEAQIRATRAQYYNDAIDILNNYEQTYEDAKLLADSIIDGNIYFNITITGIDEIESAIYIGLISEAIGQLKYPISFESCLQSDGVTLKVGNEEDALLDSYEPLTGDGESFEDIISDWSDEELIMLIELANTMTAISKLVIGEDSDD